MPLRIPACLFLLTMFTTGCTTLSLWDEKSYDSASVPRLALSPQTEDILVGYDERCFAFRFQTGEIKPISPLTPRAYWLFASTNTVKHHPPAFVEATNSGDLIPIPLVVLDPMGRSTNRALLMFNLMGNITNRANQDWLLHERRDAYGKSRPGSVALVAAKPGRYVFAGTNALGQKLFITNAPPERGYYMAISGKPKLPRYIMTTNPPPDSGYYAASLGNAFALWRDGKAAGKFELPMYSTFASANFWRVTLTPLAVAADVVIVGVIIGGAVVIMASPGAAGA